MWCNKGYTLIGPAVKICNGSDGYWDPTETSCVRKLTRYFALKRKHSNDFILFAFFINNNKTSKPASSCPPLPRPSLGTLPENCLNGRVSVGESCAIICPPGTKNNGVPVAQCLAPGQWSALNLNCVAFKPHLRGRISKSENHPQVRVQEPPHRHQPIAPSFKETDQHKPSIAQRPNIIPYRPPVIFRPYIKCPRDTTIVLPKNQKTVYVRLEQPKSNVDWTTHVEANPSWAKKLQAHLGAGVHTITFRAHSPNSNSITESCTTVITIKSSIVSMGPLVNFCPQAIDVQLQQHEQQRSIFWREPVFNSKVPLKQIFKSNVPGTKLGVGRHRITYIATDIHNQNGTCQFIITVRPPGEWCFEYSVIL